MSLLVHHDFDESQNFHEASSFLRCALASVGLVYVSEQIPQPILMLERKTLAPANDLAEPIATFIYAFAIQKCRCTEKAYRFKRFRQYSSILAHAFIKPH